MAGLEGVKRARAASCAHLILEQAQFGRLRVAAVGDALAVRSAAARPRGPRGVEDHAEVLRRVRACACHRHAQPPPAAAVSAGGSAAASVGGCAAAAAALAAPLALAPRGPWRSVHCFHLCQPLNGGGACLRRAVEGVQAVQEIVDLQRPGWEKWAMG